MTDKVDETFPDRLRIRDTRLYDDMGGAGQRIYTTAGQGYRKVDYVRADLYDAQASEIAELKADLLDASDAHLWIRKNRELAAEVERLKRNDDSYRDIANQSRLNINRLSALVDAQAAEVERLRALISGYYSGAPKMWAENERLHAHIERGREIHERLTNFASHSMEWDMALDEAIAYLSPHAKSKAIDAIEP